MRVFLIGAGASAALSRNIPITKTILPSLVELSAYKLYADDRTSAINEYLNSKAIPSLEHWKTTYIDTQKQPNLEELIETALVEDTPLGRGFYEAILHAFYQLIEKPLAQILNEQRQTVYWALVRQLKADDVVLSLNYDTALDSSISNFYHRGGVGMPYHINYGPNSALAFEDILPNRALPVLLKLHGSFNWISELNKIRVYRKGKVPQVNYEGWNVQVVPPHITKGRLPRHKVLDEVWECADSYTKDAVDDLVVIGCSLQPYDVELTQLLSKFTPSTVKLITLKRNEQNYNELVQRCQDIFKIDKSKLRIWGKGFTREGLTSLGI